MEAKRLALRRFWRKFTFELWANRLLLSGIAFLVVGLLFANQIHELFDNTRVVPYGVAGNLRSFEYKITRVEEQETFGTESFERKAEGIYKVVTISVTNIGRRTRAINEGYFSLIDSEGIEYFPVCRIDWGSCGEVLPKTFTERLVHPDQTSIGVFIFDVDPTAQDLRLKILRDPFPATSVQFALEP